jgi:phosphoesterase, MJ0936 family
VLIGVVSDTHNNINNILNIVKIFNEESVDLVVHTGDISKPRSLKLFSGLNCSMLGVYGNNDRNEAGLKETCKELGFKFKEPPYLVKLEDKKIAIFHEPDNIEDYIKTDRNVDLVLHGHTHRYKKEIIDNVIYFNPGESAGLMKGKNALGIVNLKNLEIRRIFF